MVHACKRVLVVEDDAELRESIVDFLTSERIEPISVPSGEAALETLQHDPLPDVILLDLNMPGLPGLDLMRRIQDDPRLGRIPVAVMSGYPRGRFAYAPPEVEYLEKPFDLDRLNAVLAKLCAKAKTGTE